METCSLSKLHPMNMCASFIKRRASKALQLFVMEDTNSMSRCIVFAGFANELLAEASLTTRCLQYLCMPCFGKDISPQNILIFALQGHYIFQEYAVAKWTIHFNALFSKLVDAEAQRAKVVKRMEKLPLDGHVWDDQLAELEDSLSRFIETYAQSFDNASQEKELLQERTENQQQKQGKRSISPENYALWDDLYTVQAHIQQHRLRHSENGRVSIEALGQSFTNIRNFLENPGEEPYKLELSRSEESTLQTYYGDKRYKCPTLHCQRFVEGFADRRDRQKHVEREQRPFRCGEESCSGDFGFTSAIDLEKHQKRFHPSQMDDAETFDPLPDPKNDTAKWPCPHCPKRFTRGFHMRNHVRTHTDDKPFSCVVCGRAFTRDYDRKRHEKTLHTNK
jgi:hypothetical protein